MKTALRPVSPSNCALAICLPLTYEDFLDHLRPDREEDFAKHVRRSNAQRSVSDDYYWEWVYEPVARRILRLCKEVQNYGVKVVYEATLKDLQGLLSSSMVVTAFAHWRFMPVLLSDIRDPDKLLAALDCPTNELARHFSVAIRRRVPGIADHLAGSRYELITDLICGINEVIRSSHQWYLYEDERSDQLIEPSVEDLQRLTRPAFEHAFEGLVSPGRAIELGDGMHTIEEFVSSIPTGFDGILDLTVCNSVLLGAAVKRWRPSTTVVVNRYPTDIRIRMTLYYLTASYLQRKKVAYLDALIETHRMVQENRRAYEA